MNIPHIHTFNNILRVSGNTGIGIALLCAARRYRCILCMPSTISPEKIAMMRQFGAEVRLAPAVPFGHHEHYYR